MRKYIDCIRITDVNLAYTIVEALEKDENYSVDFYTQDNGPIHKGEPCHEIELRVYHNQKVTPIPHMGFSDVKQEEKKKDESC